MQSHMIFSLQRIKELQLTQQCDTPSSDILAQNWVWNILHHQHCKSLYIKSIGFSSQSWVLYNSGNTATIINVTIASTCGTSTIGMMASSNQRANHNAINQVLASHAVHCLSATCKNALLLGVRNISKYVDCRTLECWGKIVCERLCTKCETCRTVKCWRMRVCETFCPRMVLPTSAVSKWGIEGWDHPQVRFWHCSNTWF